MALPPLPLAYHSARGRFLLLVLLTVFTALFGYALTYSASGYYRLLGWVALPVGGLLAVVFLRELFTKAPRLTLTATGITDRRLPVGEIAWADITAAALRSVGSTHHLLLALRNPASYLARLPPTRRRVAENNLAQGDMPLYLDLSSVRADPPAVLAIVRQLAGLPPP